MAGNNSLQILRGSDTAIKATTEVLLPGQPLHNKTYNFLYVGTGGPVNTTEPVTTNRVVAVNGGGQVLGPYGGSTGVYVLGGNPGVKIALGSSALAINSTIDPTTKFASQALVVKNDGQTIVFSNSSDKFIHLNPNGGSPSDNRPYIAIHCGSKYFGALGPETLILRGEQSSLQLWGDRLTVKSTVDGTVYSAELTIPVKLGDSGNTDTIATESWVESRCIDNGELLG